jgi:CubicO group peptidase (beta-lactamase class C family)
MMGTLVRRLSAAALLGITAAAVEAATVLTVPRPLGPQELATPSVQPEARHELTKTDADAWLDGYIPYALAQGDVAGAVVVIVKDGHVLTQLGYGYADVAAGQRVDPATTMFRPGSISKLFTWTAVMQLVEQGRIDLDADVNRYLDFTIPRYQGEPLTMRDLMTHRTGFEQSVKGLIHLGGKMSPMGDVLQRWIPRRVVAPGTTPAYSNYGAGLAGYIVQRVSGMPYEEYVERHIFQPLGMTHSTFRQPLPTQFAPFMARGYPRASAEAKPYELIEPSGAGGSAMSGSDMAQFMIAHLNQGAGLMQPATARLMHNPAYAAVPGTDRMALGFYETRVNGLSAIGHAGDSFYFHSALWLLPSQHVGLFIAMNSIGTNRAVAVDPIRKALLEQFGDRYWPAADAAVPVELPTAKEHAKMLVGSYASSVGSFSNFADVANFLGQTHIGLDQDGRPSIPGTPGLGGAPPRWIEIAPFVWQKAHGREHLGATVENGKVVRWSMDDPTSVRERVSWYRDAAWLQPVGLAALVLIGLTALSWPAGAIARRRYGAALALNSRDLTAYPLVSIFSWLVLATLLGWMSLLAELIPLVDNDGSLDWRIWLLQIGGTIGGCGLAALALWNLRRVWQGVRSGFSRLWSALLVFAALVILWVMLAFHLISFGTHY